MPTYTKSWKNCATCAFWTGARTCNCFNDKITVNGSIVKGTCAIPRGGWKGSQKEASQSCSDWQKYPGLK